MRYIDNAKSLIRKFKRSNISLQIGLITYPGVLYLAGVKYRVHANKIAMHCLPSYWSDNVTRNGDYIIMLTLCSRSTILK